MKKIIILLSFFLINLNSYSQCSINSFTANGTSVLNNIFDTIDICIGDSVLLTASGVCGYLMNNDFNNNTIGAGWASNASPMFTNPCGTGPNGTTYLWIGPATSFPRQLTTTPFDVSSGGCNINFWMKYASQANSTPCEGPDLITEGVHLQYSYNGVAGPFTDIQYWDPLGGYNATMTSWQTYNVAVPPLAATINTTFRFYQTNTSGNDYDHWGLDDVKITCPASTAILWSNGVIGNSIVVSPTTTTHYILTLIDTLNNTQLQDSVIIRVHPFPGATTTFNSHLCKGVSSTFTYTGIGTTNANYLWIFDPLSNIVSGSGQGPYSAYWDIPGTFPIILTVSEFNCSSSDTSYIVIDENPIPEFTASPLVGCDPLTVNFTDVSFPSIQTRQWDFGDLTSSSNTSNLQNPMHTYLDSGWYDVKLVVSTTGTCTDSVTLLGLIHVIKEPVAEFSLSPLSATSANPLITFCNLSLNSTSWYWNFGDIGSIGNTSSLKNPTHSYSTNGSFSIWLIAQNDICIDSAVHTIEISPVPPPKPETPFSVYIPNAFSPNGEGNNEIFIPLGEGIDSSYYEMSVFDRWGELIFKSDEMNKGWNGKKNNVGSTLPSGIYVYLIKLRRSDGIKQNYSGQVLLFR